MTIVQIADDIRDRLRNYNDTSQDTDISTENIFFNLTNFRALYLRREINKHRSIKSFEQDLGCVKLIDVDKSECEMFPAGCKVKRTEFKLPKFVRRRNKEAITFVGDVNKINRIVLDETFNIPWNKFNQYTSNELKAYYLNDYIYVTESHTIKQINIRGVVEDPLDLRIYGENATDCFNYKTDSYPIPRDMIPQIIEDTVKLYLGTSEQTAEDIVNDRQDTDAQTQR